VDGVSNTVHPWTLFRSPSALVVRLRCTPELRGAPGPPLCMQVHTSRGVAAVVMRRAPEPGIRGVAASSTAEVESSQRRRKVPQWQRARRPERPRQ